MSEPPVPACTECGACCSSRDPRWIAVFEGDRERMDDRALALTVELEGRRYMRMDPAQGCAALVGRRCGIYAVRPDACRWLERGSSVCRSLIELRLHE